MVLRKRFLAVIGLLFSGVVLSKVTRQVQAWIGTVFPWWDSDIQNTNNILIKYEYPEQLFGNYPLIGTHVGGKDEKRLRVSLNDPETVLRSSRWFDILIKNVNLRSAGLQTA